MSTHTQNVLYQSNWGFVDTEKGDSEGLSVVVSLSHMFLQLLELSLFKFEESKRITETDFLGIDCPLMDNQL